MTEESLDLERAARALPGTITALADPSSRNFLVGVAVGFLLITITLGFLPGEFRMTQPGPEETVDIDDGASIDFSCEIHDGWVYWETVVCEKNDELEYDILAEASENSEKLQVVLKRSDGIANGGFDFDNQEGLKEGSRTSLDSLIIEVDKIRENEADLVPKTYVKPQTKVNFVSSVILLIIIVISIFTAWYQKYKELEDS